MCMNARRDRERSNRHEKKQNESKKMCPYHHHFFRIISLSLSDLVLDRSDFFTPALVLENETDLIFPIGLFQPFSLSLAVHF